MVTKIQFVEEVKSWIGTPFHHEGRVKGAGIDCVGVAAASGANLGLKVIDMEHYPKRPIDGMFEKAVDAQTIPASLDQLQLGDILKFRIREEPQHLAIVTQLVPQIRITHAFAQAKKCVENDLDNFWLERLVGVRRIEELE